MPRGSKPGERRGGKKKGTLNKRTLEKIAETAREAQDKHRVGKKFAREVLDDLMNTAVSFAAREQRRIMKEEGQPGPDGVPAGVASRETLDRFWLAMNAAGTFARALAPFQSPTYKAIAVLPQPDPDTLVKTIEGDAVKLTDPVAVSRLYQQMVRVVK